MPHTNAIILTNCDGHDTVALFDDNMSSRTANHLANEAIVAAKEAQPDEYTIQDVKKELVKRGFKMPRLTIYGPRLD